MSEARLACAPDGTCRVEGALDLHTVAELWKASLPLFREVRPLVLDLGGVGRADSAGLALLVEWSRQARRGRTALRFVNVPAQIRSLARVSHLEWLLAREWQPNTADRAEEPA